MTHQFKMTPGVWMGLPGINLGFLPDILRPEDPRPVKEQLEDRYAHGGGWRPIKGFRLNRASLVMRFPGDPPYTPAAMIVLGDELVIYYPLCSLFCVIQKGGKFEVSRCD